MLNEYQPAASIDNREHHTDDNACDCDHTHEDDDNTVEGNANTDWKSAIVAEWGACRHGYRDSKDVVERNILDGVGRA